MELNEELIELLNNFNNCLNEATDRYLYEAYKGTWVSPDSDERARTKKVIIETIIDNVAEDMIDTHTKWL